MLRPEKEALLTLVHLPKTPTTCANLEGGAFVHVATRDVQAIRSPYTGDVIGHVPMSNAADVDRVVGLALRAARDWGAVPIKERTQFLFRFRELVLANLDHLAHTAASESGKTVAEGRAGVQKGLEVVEFALSLQNFDDGGVLEVSRGVTCEVRREALGVVAGITPFNFPAMVSMWMFPIAVTLGNCFVLKPSEKVPLTACVLGELMVEAGFPAGVFSVVHGGKTAVEALCDHPDIRAVAFVGSTPVAQGVYARATSHGKRALALGGAKNILILAPDADPEIAVEGVVSSFTGCAGQRCMAASLMVAVGDVDPMIDRMVLRAKSMQLGRDMGALIDRGAVERLSLAVQKAAQGGAKIRLDGRSTAAPEGYDGGNWFGPTILDGVDPKSESATRELFGPVLSIVRAKNLEEALSLEQSSPYGNAISVFTQSGAVARRVAERSQSGMVGVNIGVPVPREPFSFGGTKESRFGHGDITGRGGVEFWSSLKKITSKWSLEADRNWMS